METLFRPENWWIWGLLMAGALFMFVHRIIYGLALNRTQARQGPPDDETRRRLYRRTGITAALLAFVFSAFYARHMFGP